MSRIIIGFEPVTYKQIAGSFNKVLSFWERVKVFFGIPVYCSFVVTLRVESLIDQMEVDIQVGDAPPWEELVEGHDGKH